jgi:hypothetical protein
LAQNRRARKIATDNFGIPEMSADFENGQNAVGGTIEKTTFLLVEIREPAVRNVVEVMPRELTIVSDKKRNRWRSGDPD